MIATMMDLIAMTDLIGNSDGFDCDNDGLYYWHLMQKISYNHFQIYVCFIYNKNFYLSIPLIYPLIPAPNCKSPPTTHFLFFLIILNGQPSSDLFQIFILMIC